MQHLGDITKIRNPPFVDCITFGSPCQDLSVAGRRQGLQGARSRLFMEAVRIIREMREASGNLYPTFAVWENVPGAFSSNNGEDFRTVLEELVRIAQPNAAIPRPDKRWGKSGYIAGDGYSLAWRTMDAQYWGVPQRRRRIALVVDFGGQRAGEILFERESVSGHSEPSIPPWKGIARESERCIDRQSKLFCMQGNVIDRHAQQNGAGIAESYTMFTINAIDRHGVCYSVGNGQTNGLHPRTKARALDCMHDHQAIIYKSSMESLHWVIRRMTPSECERLQGYPDGWTDIGEWADTKNKLHKSADGLRYKALGNSIALPQWWWLICKMAQYLPERPTLGSLFDGIGGFLLVWETRYGPGTAVWASEIEPFAIAVTKKRFPESSKSKALER